jgi:hypothetical protein
VYLECGGCNSGAGVRLGMPVSKLPGAFKGSDLRVALGLHEKAGWLQDSKNTLAVRRPTLRPVVIVGTIARPRVLRLMSARLCVSLRVALQPWTVPSRCTFIQVLSGLTSVRILGDFTKWCAVGRTVT